MNGCGNHMRRRMDMKLLQKSMLCVAVAISAASCASLPGNGAKGQSTDTERLYNSGVLLLDAHKLRLDEVRELVRKGADVNYQHSENGTTALMSASKSNPDPSVVEELLFSGANTALKDMNGMTALMHAGFSKQDNIEHVILLLDAGASVNETDKDGRSAFTAVARYSANPDIVSLFFDAGADASLKDKDGLTPYDSALANPVPGITGVFLANGSSLETVNAMDMTPLIWVAINNDNPEVARLLVESGAKIDALAGTMEESAFHWAAASNTNPGMIKYFLSKGVDVNQRDGVFRTALMKAALMNANPEIVGILLSSGADKNMKDFEGKTAFDWAIGENNFNLINSPYFGNLKP
jgi:ankyrin repeat protein